MLSRPGLLGLRLTPAWWTVIAMTLVLVVLAVWWALLRLPNPLALASSWEWHVCLVTISGLLDVVRLGARRSTVWCGKWTECDLSLLIGIELGLGCGMIAFGDVVGMV